MHTVKPGQYHEIYAPRSTESRVAVPGPVTSLDQLFMQASAAHLMLRRKAQVTYPQNAICYASRTKDQYKRRVQPARYKRPVQTVPYEPARVLASHGL